MVFIINKLVRNKHLSPIDVRTILSSMQIMIHNKHFCKYFGREIAKIEWIRQIPSNQLEVLQSNEESSNIFKGISTTHSNSPTHDGEDKKENHGNEANNSDSYSSDEDFC